MTSALRGLTLLLGGLLLCGLLAGCAGYQVQRDGCGTGYDVYAPAPYLLRTQASAGVYDFKVVYLPDYSKRYRVHSWAGLGKSAVKFTFADGWQLTAIDANLDNTAVAESISSLVDIIGKFGALPEGASAATTSNESPTLFQIVFNECTGQPCGLRQVPLSLPTQEAYNYDTTALPPACPPPPPLPGS
ncbi:MAG: hypothetical protein O2894_01885 [Planctomycetota bacterium]|nr:hypothetical protein [Planctomycetota bacterium]